MTTSNWREYLWHMIWGCKVQTGSIDEWDKDFLGILCGLDSIEHIAAELLYINIKRFKHLHLL
jgi:hypothetical protein